MANTFEIYVKHTSNCEGVPLTSFEPLSETFKVDETSVRFDTEDGYQWHKVVGWTDLFGGTATTVSVCWVRNSGHVGVLVYGGNSGIRVLSRKFKPAPGVDEHLPRGYGQPWIWLQSEDVKDSLPQEVLAIIGTPITVEMRQKTDQELVEICNIPRHNSSIIEYAQSAYAELISRGKTPEIVRRDSEGAPIYALKEEN